MDDENQAREITVKNLNAGGGFGGSSEVTNGTSANTIEEDSVEEGTSYTSNGDDENALRIDGAKVSLDILQLRRQAEILLIQKMGISMDRMLDF